MVRQFLRCVAVLARVRDAEESLLTNHASVSGRLRVDVATVFARVNLIPLMAEFQARFPGIRLELGCSDRPVNLVEQGVDCALRGGEITDQNLIARRIGAMHFVTCATPAYFEKRGGPAHPRDLGKHTGPNEVSTTGRSLARDFHKDGEQRQRPRHGPRAATARSDGRGERGGGGQAGRRRDAGGSEGRGQSADGGAWTAPLDRGELPAAQGQRAV